MSAPESRFLRKSPLPTVLEWSRPAVGVRSSPETLGNECRFDVVSVRRRLEDGDRANKGARLLDVESKRVSVKDEELK